MASDVADGTGAVLRVLALGGRGVSRSFRGGKPVATALKRELDLRFQAAIIGRLVESFAILSTGNLVGKAEIRGGDVADNRSGVGVIEQVPDGEPDAEVEAVRRGRGADEPAQPAAAHRRQRRALPRGSGGARVARSGPLPSPAEPLLR